MFCFVLQAPRSEVVLVISRCKSDTTVESIEILPQTIDQTNSGKNGKHYIQNWHYPYRYFF